MRPSPLFGLALLSVACALPGSAQQGAADGEWRFYGGGPGSTGYSSLSQIDRDNVHNLEIAWRWSARNMGPRPELKNSTTPLMVDGVLYFTAGSRRNVIAVNAGSGETLWIWRMDEGERGRRAPRPNSGRGVAYWTDGAGDERVYVVTPGYHLVALHARTGREVETFGNEGVIDLKTTMGVEVDLIEGIIGSSSPPLISHDVIVVGPALEVGLRPPSMENVPGFVQAFDARTGEQKWIFHTVPRPGEFGVDTWEEGSESYTGNAGVWAPMSVDEELGYIYLPVEAATSDLYGGHRLGDNLFSTSLVALDIETGERVWHYQLVHHDIWDWDIPTAPILLDVEVDGQPVRAVAQITKQGFVYVFDRLTGAPVWPIEETPVPQSDVPGERASPTQPIPSKPAPFDRQGFSVDDLIDFTPELRAAAEEIASRYRMGPLYTPASLADSVAGTRGTLSLPSTTGGANWEGGAADAEEGVLYIGSATRPSVLLLVPPRPGTSDLDYIAGAGFVRGPRRLPLVKPPYGRITAIDLSTGEHLWMTANGNTPPNISGNPALDGVEIPRTGSSSRAGLLVTKTLLFAGEGWGGQPFFRAHDKTTGEILWETELPGTQTGIPMTFMYDDRQYIVFTVGGQGGPAELIAFALPE